MSEQATDTLQPRESAAILYQRLETIKSPFVRRAQKCADLTIPTLFRENGQKNGNDIKDPDQTLGASGVNALASKMILSLMPLNTPFFKLQLSDEVVEQLDGDEEAFREVMKSITTLERNVLSDIEASGDVTACFEMLKHLLVTGNVLAFVGENGMRIYDLNEYVVVRDFNGEWRKIVIKEEVRPSELDPDFVAKLSAEGKISVHKPDGTEKTVAIYTLVKREGDRVLWHQEVADEVVPGTESNVPKEGCPWIPLRFLRVDGEPYGRSYIEMFLTDLEVLGSLTKAITDAAKASAKVLFLVNPNGTTNAKSISGAPNLAVRSGNANDVTVLRVDKQGDMRVAYEMVSAIEKRLSYAFMLHAQTLRDAERVTAEEIRFVAQELDASLGGIYSLLSKEFQLPYVQRRLHLLKKRLNVQIPKFVKPVIVTGFAALGRGHDSDRLLRFLNKLQLAASVAETLGNRLNMDELILRFAVSEGIETDGLLVPVEVRQAQEQQAAMMSMSQALGPEVIRQAGNIFAKGVETNGTEAQDQASES